MARLVRAVKKAAARGYLRGIDGRHVSIRSDHAALNSLLQSAGAVAMKRALVLLDSAAASLDYDYSGNIHDELQLDCNPTNAEELGTTAAQSITKAGEFYSFQCPLKGNYVIGKNWAETH